MSTTKTTGNGIGFGSLLLLAGVGLWLLITAKRLGIG